MSLPASGLGCGSKDVFDKEHVCVHVFTPDIKIPEPLLERYEDIPARSPMTNLFNIGIPEILLCTTTSSFLQMFQYFWPITREEFQRVHGMISPKFEKPEIIGKADIDAVSKYLEEHRSSLYSKDTKSAILFTFNDYTKYWSAHLVALWQNSNVPELVIFKNPAHAPYLCDFPSLQKGFKRPPP
jgi:hypothetical protein